jgi:hypothetical protein
MLLSLSISVAQSVLSMAGVGMVEHRPHDRDGSWVRFPARSMLKFPYWSSSSEHFVAAC